jgi:hypothetical protein
VRPATALPRERPEALAALLADWLRRALPDRATPSDLPG